MLKKNKIKLFIGLSIILVVLALAIFNIIDICNRSIEIPSFIGSISYTMEDKMLDLVEAIIFYGALLIPSTFLLFINVNNTEKSDLEKKYSEELSKIKNKNLSSYPDDELLSEIKLRIAPNNKLK